MLVSFFCADYSNIVLGDGIRVQKILETLRKSSLKIVETRIPGQLTLPPLSQNTIFESKGQKTILFNVFPVLKFDNRKLASTRRVLRKQLDFSVLLNSLVRSIARLKPDVLLAETSTIGWIASIVAKRLSIPCVIDVHGIVFAEIAGWGDPTWRQFREMEKEAFENCSHLIVVSQKMEEYIEREFGVPRSRMSVIPNGSDVQQSIAHYENPLKVIYAGAFAYWEKVNDFLDIAKQANSTAFNFYLAGSGQMREQLLNRIREEHIPISYLGYIPRDKIREVFAQMQIGVAPSTRDIARQVASPIKVFDYMASGLPVVTPKIGDWGNIIEKEDSGVAIENDGPEDYVKALDTLLNRDVWEGKSKNAVRAIREKYTWEKVLEPIPRLLLAYN